MNAEQYRALFVEPKREKDDPKEADTRAGRALVMALDIRKFEIELYWKRATYFWTFIGAAFAGYALTYKSSESHEPWLSMLFSSLGLVFAFAWYLVNRGSKFWQNNWERHVDLLEEITLGPLYQLVAFDSDRANPLTSSGEFSVTKLNQILSVFVFLIWAVLFVYSLCPISFNLPLHPFKCAVVLVTISCVVLLYRLGRSSNEHTKFEIRRRETQVAA